MQYNSDENDEYRRQPVELFCCLPCEILGDFLPHRGGAECTFDSYGVRWC